jgi:phenylalanyl-tRNA synthetase beta subunit
MAGPELFCVDFDLAALGDLPLVRRAVRPVPPVPLPAFNVTVILASGQSAREVLDLVGEAGGTRRDLVQVRDVFQGERIGPGRTSLTIRAEFWVDDTAVARAEGRRRREAVLAAARDRGWDCR